MMNKFDVLVQKLAFARDGLAEAKNNLKEMKRRLEASSKWKRWAELQSFFSEGLTETDTQLREYAISFGKGRHHPAVSVEEWTALFYDADEALTWCIDNLPNAILLDIKAFEKHAKAIAKTAPLPFVKMGKEFKVKVASNLLPYLPKEDENGPTGRAERT